MLILGDIGNSVTKLFLVNPKDKILKKIGEESTEVILAVKTKDNDKIIHEASDLFFHLLVMLEKVEINFDKVLLELKAREGISGIIEKNNRKCNE